MTRIRYSRIDNNMLQSRNILVGKLFVNVTIDPASLSYRIVGIDGTHVSQQSKFSSMHNLKKEVKAELKAMGAVFDDEIRQRKEDANEVTNLNEQNSL